MTPLGVSFESASAEYAVPPLPHQPPGQALSFLELQQQLRENAKKNATGLKTVSVEAKAKAKVRGDRKDEHGGLF